MLVYQLLLIASIVGAEVEDVDVKTDINAIKVILKNSENDKDKILRLLSKYKVTKHVSKQHVATAHTGAQMYKDSFSYTVDPRIVKEIGRLNSIAKWHYAPYLTRYAKPGHVFATSPRSKVTGWFEDKDGKKYPIVYIPIYDIDGDEVDNLNCVIAGKADFLDKVNQVDTDMIVGVSVIGNNAIYSAFTFVQITEYKIAANKRYLYHKTMEVIDENGQIFKNVLIVSEFSPGQDLLDAAINELNGKPSTVIYNKG